MWRWNSSLKHGYDATPMSLVAKQCGLTKAGIYHHFESKEQLLYYLHKRHIDRLLLPMIDEALKVADPEERLRKFLSDYAVLLTRDPTPRLLISEPSGCRRSTPRKSAMPGAAASTWCATPCANCRPAMVPMRPGSTPPMRHLRQSA
jgi:AcrR family transcriptional regulator